MRILLLTSADHLYANYILKELFLEGVFKEHEVTVFEQNSIIPKKNRAGGLIYYLKISGFRYVFSQIVKMYIFKILRFIVYLTNNKKSYYFPYNKIGSGFFKKCIVNNIENPKVVVKIKKIKPDVILSIFSKEIIPSSILRVPRFGSVNLHPSYLPFYRGVSPTFWALTNDEKSTGVTLHYVNKGIDAGEIIARKKIAIKPSMTEHGLYMRCAHEGQKLLSEFILIITQKTIGIKKAKKLEKSSYYSLPTKKAVDLFKSRGKKFFTLRELTSY